MVCLESPVDVDGKGLGCAALLNAAWCIPCGASWGLNEVLVQQLQFGEPNIGYLVAKTCQIISSFALISSILFFAFMHSVRHVSE